jgi:hypothetical protein
MTLKQYEIYAVNADHATNIKASNLTVDRSASVRKSITETRLWMLARYVASLSLRAEAAIKEGCRKGMG